MQRYTRPTKSVKTAKTVTDGVLRVAVVRGAARYGNAKSIVVQAELVHATLHTPYEERIS